MMLAVLGQDRAVPGVLQLGRDGGLTLHGDRLAHHPEVLPLPLVAVAVRSRGVGLVDVEVFLIDGEDGESPRTLFVMPDRDPGQRRLAGADHVPARRDEVDPVAQRGKLDRPVGIIGQDRCTRERVVAGDHPVVAPLRRDALALALAIAIGRGSLGSKRGQDVRGEEPHRSARRRVRTKETVAEERQIERLVRGEAWAAGVKVQELPGL